MQPSVGGTVSLKGVCLELLEPMTWCTPTTQHKTNPTAYPLRVAQLTIRVNIVAEPDPVLVAPTAAHPSTRPGSGGTSLQGSTTTPSYLTIHSATIFYILFTIPTPTLSQIGTTVL